MGLGSKNQFSAKVTKGWDFGNGFKVKTDWNEYKDGKGEPASRKYYLAVPTLTTADVKSANCVLNKDGNYVLTINIKDGNSKVVDNVVKNEWSPIDRSGICAGDRDMDIFDHKTAAICMRALAYKEKGEKQVPNGNNVSVDEKTTNCKAVVTVNAKTGNLVSIKIGFDLSYKIDYSGNYSATGRTTIEYKNFNW